MSSKPTEQDARTRAPGNVVLWHNFAHRRWAVFEPRGRLSFVSFLVETGNNPGIRPTGGVPRLTTSAVASVDSIGRRADAYC
jgi:hypothetical protein